MTPAAGGQDSLANFTRTQYEGNSLGQALFRFSTRAGMRGARSERMRGTRSARLPCSMCRRLLAVAECG